jgi:hypothetical protein
VFRIARDRQCGGGRRWTDDHGHPVRGPRRHHPRGHGLAAYSLGLNVSTAIFDGAAPPVLTAIIAGTGNIAVPAYYVVLTAVETTIAVIISRESSRENLRDVESTIRKTV